MRCAASMMLAVLPHRGNFQSTNHHPSVISHSAEYRWSSCPVAFRGGPRLSHRAQHSPCNQCSTCVYVRNVSGVRLTVKITLSLTTRGHYDMAHFGCLFVTATKLVGSTLTLDACSAIFVPRGFYRQVLNRAGRSSAWRPPSF